MKKSNVKVYIVGSGLVGRTLARQLANDGCEVTVVDKDMAILDEIGNTLDVIGFQGNGASYKSLKELNAQDADILIAVTASDELNMLSCFTAHHMGTTYTIARVRDIDYAQSEQFYRDEMGISMTLNPELETASEIYRVLRFPQATRIELFARGAAELVEMKVPSESLMVGKTLIEINQSMGINLLICAIHRGEDTFVPIGNTVIEANDTLYLTGAANEFRNSFSKLRLTYKPLKSVMITGRDMICYHLAEKLSKAGVRVTIVDPDKEACENFATKLPKVSVICDDSLEYFDSMSETDLANTDAFISITHDDEFNLIASMYAETQGIGKIVAGIREKKRLKVVPKKSGISTISREDVAVERILGYTRARLNASGNDAVESLYRLMDGQIEFAEFKVKETERHLGIPLKELNIKRNYLIAAIIRNGSVIIPRGDDYVSLGDRVVVASINNQISNLEDIYE